MHRERNFFYISLFAMHDFEVCMSWACVTWDFYAAVAATEPKAIRAKTLQ
jgi:hypothetical protein